MGKVIDLTNKRFGQLTVISFHSKNNNNKLLWNCQCDCGNKKIIIGQSLREGKSTCCGIKGCPYHGSNKNKNYNSELYFIWYDMMRRCYNKNRKEFKHYGARGIKVCNAWHNINFFINDMGERPKGHYLERIDTNKNYERNNCKWATMKEQQNNKTNNIFIKYKDSEFTLMEICEKFKLDYQHIWHLGKKSRNFQKIIDGFIGKQ